METEALNAPAVWNREKSGVRLSASLYSQWNMLLRGRGGGEGVKPPTAR